MTFGNIFGSGILVALLTLCVGFIKQDRIPQSATPAHEDILSPELYWNEA